MRRLKEYLIVNVVKFNNFYEFQKKSMMDST